MVRCVLAISAVVVTLDINADGIIHKAACYRSGVAMSC